MPVGRAPGTREEFRDPLNLYATEAPEREEVGVTGSDGVRSSGESCFKDPVIGHVPNETHCAVNEQRVVRA
jgi:hypothetical protein